MNSWVVQQVRTWVPVIVGSFAAWLLTLGVDLSAEAQGGLVVGLTGLIVGVYYTVTSWLAKKWPWLGFLLGSTRQPVYGPTAKELKAGTSGPAQPTAQPPPNTG